MTAGKIGKTACENPHPQNSDVCVVWDSGWKEGAALVTELMSTTDGIRLDESTTYER